MSLVALDGTPLVLIGGAQSQGTLSLSGENVTTIDAVNEACIMYGYVFTSDGASHTIDTTGSSALGWRSSTLTFANAGTTVKVGLAAIDAANGPPARAANASNVITFDVSKSLTGGGGGITANAWQSHAPDTGTKTIANGDLVAFCVQMTARGGADVVRPSTVPVPFGTGNSIPGVTQYISATYTNGSPLLPNAIITFSDGAKGYFFGGFVYNTSNVSQTWNSGSATKEYGNYFLLPVPMKVYGVAVSCNFAGNTDVILYSDPLGTPVAEKTVSVDLNTIGNSAVNEWAPILFPAPYSATASQPLAGIIKPTSVTNVTANYITLNASADQAAHTLGTNCYAVNRASGAFAAQNSGKDRFAIGLLVGAFDAGGGGAGIARLAGGGLVH